MSDDANSAELLAERKRSERAWQRRQQAQPLLDDVYDYCMPFRRGNKSRGGNDRLFDMTSMVGAMHSAQGLANDISPPGSRRVEIEPGPAARGLPPGERRQIEMMLRGVADDINPFFDLGDFDTALQETCADLLIGRGAILPVKGNARRPVRFINIPIEQIATLSDRDGEPFYIDWRVEDTVEAVRETWPDVDFGASFSEEAKSKPDGMVTLHQGYHRQPDGRWVMRLRTSKGPIAWRETYRTQPMSLPIFWRTPGDEFGAGPLLMAMPSIKTLNKAQELTLRAAAIQMLGIWAYRAGGTFNPDMVRIGAGEFWPMMSTGGMLGPDVQRLDPASGNVNIARMVLDSMREDLKGVLMDRRVPQKPGTPVSAQEIVARMQEAKQANVGAFGRLARSIMPVIVPRVAEILFEIGYLQSPWALTPMLAAIQTRSPMQVALEAGQIQAMVSWLDMIQALAPGQVSAHADIDGVLDQVAKWLSVPANVRRTPEQRQQIQEQQNQAQIAEQAAAFALEAQKVAPEQPAGVAIL